MRTASFVVTALATVMLAAGPAFGHRHQHRVYGYGYGYGYANQALVSPQGAFLPGLLNSLLPDLLHGLLGQLPIQQPQQPIPPTPQRVTVTKEVSDTINRANTAVKKLVDKTNAIDNPKYKDKIPVASTDGIENPNIP